MQVNGRNIIYKRVTPRNVHAQINCSILASCVRVQACLGCYLTNCVSGGRVAPISTGHIWLGKIVTGNRLDCGLVLARAMSSVQCVKISEIIFTQRLIPDLSKPSTATDNGAPSQLHHCHRAIRCKSHRGVVLRTAEAHRACLRKRHWHVARSRPQHLCPGRGQLRWRQLLQHLQQLCAEGAVWACAVNASTPQSDKLES
jgi:hypothetical protein